MLGRRGVVTDGVPPVVVALAANLVLLAGLALGLGPALLALAVAVPLGLALVERPQRGLLALVALTPFNGLLVLLPLPPMAAYWKEALTIATLAATFLAPAGARGRPGRSWPSWGVAVVGLLAVATVSGVAIGGIQALVGLKITFFYVAVLVAVWRCPFDERERDGLVTILMGVGAVTAAFGLLQQLLGPARLSAMGFPYNSTIRFAGSFMRSFSTFIQPFGFGFFLMVVVLVCLPVALSAPTRLRNQAFLLLLPLYALAILSTIVRGAWLGAAVGVVFLGAHRYRLLLLLLPLALVAVLFLPPEATSAAFSGSSSAERAVGWRENLPSVVDHPLGTGIGSTGSAALAAARLTGAATTTYQTDNYYIKVVLELGLIGVWLFVLLLAGTFSVARQAGRRRDGPDGALAAGISASILGAAAACTVATYFEIFPMDLLFWLLVGVAADLAVPAEAPLTVVESPRLIT